VFWLGEKPFRPDAIKQKGLQHFAQILRSTTVAPSHHFEQKSCNKGSKVKKMAAKEQARRYYPKAPI